MTLNTKVYPLSQQLNVLHLHKISYSIFTQKYPILFRAVLFAIDCKWKFSGVFT